jgi:hypothetical protein
MSRSDNIVHAHLFHITWDDDCLAFCFAKSKTDQTGRNSYQVWHVYATPDKHATCPVLGLATYVFANPGLTNVENFTETDGDGNPSGRLFPGGDQYGRFMDCLRRIIVSNEDEFLQLGVRPGDLGSHSAVKDKILTLLKYFTVGGHGIRGEIFQMLYFCFASLYFNFLVECLPKRSKLQASSPFFTHIPSYAREAATVRMPWNKTANTPVITGMPPHVSILTKIEEMKLALKTATDAILNGDEGRSGRAAAGVGVVLRQRGNCCGDKVDARRHDPEDGSYCSLVLLVCTTGSLC